MGTWTKTFMWNNRYILTTVLIESANSTRHLTLHLDQNEQMINLDLFAEDRGSGEGV